MLRLIKVNKLEDNKDVKIKFSHLNKIDKAHIYNNKFQDPRPLVLEIECLTTFYPSLYMSISYTSKFMYNEINDSGFNIYQIITFLRVSLHKHIRKKKTLL